MCDTRLQGENRMEPIPSVHSHFLNNFLEALVVREVM